jgi:hypothetical protein
MTTGNLSALIGGGGVKPVGLINGVSGLNAANFCADATALTSNSGYLKVVNTPALTAGVLSTILSLTGRGAINFLAGQPGNTTVRTHRFKVTLDGIVIFDGTSTATNSASRILNVIGQVYNPATATSVVIPEMLTFETSLLIEYASSLTETGQTSIGYRYFSR